MSPGRGWEAVEAENYAPSQLLEKGFFPLLAVVGITAFGHNMYRWSTFSVAGALQSALGQFMVLFLGLYVARALFDGYLWRVADATADTRRMHTVCIYTLSVLGVIMILENICPISFAVLWFLRAFVALVAWQAREYLGVSKFKEGPYILFAIAALVVCPVLIGLVFGWLTGL